MRLGGLQKTSLIDFPGKISAVVFTQGCNFRCGFCHNPDLIPTQSGRSDLGTSLRSDLGDALSEVEFFEFLLSRKGKLEGVVITGGEPTIQADLPQFISRIRDHEYSVKLDTNGSNPLMLEGLTAGKQIDYAAMDIKGPLESYTNISRFDDTENIRKSIEIIESSGLPYEFRTTVLPAYHKIEDFEKMGELIRGAERFAVQGFRPENTFDKSLEKTEIFTRSDLLEIAEIMRKYVKEVVIRENL